MELVQLIGLIVLAAAVGEGIIEFIPVPLLNLILPKSGWQEPEIHDRNSMLRTCILNTLSAILGVGIALNFNLGVFGLLGATGQIRVLDSILTGILIGRGSNYAHGFIKRFVMEKASN